MKSFLQQLAYFAHDKKVRRNTWALMKYLLFVLAVIGLYAVLFHLIMWYEGRSYSWFTGIYWSLQVMSTLGFGDLTFETELGHVFTIFVLLSGIILLLIVLPFTFIRFFYGPWLEAQIRSRTPREVGESTKGHIIIAEYDSIVPGLIERLEEEGYHYYVIEPDVDRAAQMYLDGISVINGQVDNTETYRALRVDEARMVLANGSDALNTNITLTVREVSEKVPVVASASRESAARILKLSQASHVLPLKRWLGEQLANRVNAAHTESHVIGHYHDLMIAELPVHRTPLVGRSLRETRLREMMGVSIIGVWERGKLQPARPDFVLSNTSVPVVIGTAAQFEELNALLMIYDVNTNPVVVVGAGDVGKAAVRALRRKSVPVHVIEQDAARYEQMQHLALQVFRGDATHEDLLQRAGVAEAPSIILTTNDDATNIYLATLCRHLNPEARIISRIQHERNLEAIHRAGADFVLGSSAIAIEAVVSLLKGRELILLGEGVNLFTVAVPPKLHGKTLAESGIGAETGLSVIAIHQNGTVQNSPSAHTRLEPESELIMLGDPHQRQAFHTQFEV